MKSSLSTAGPTSNSKFVKRTGAVDDEIFWCQNYGDKFKITVMFQITKESASEFFNHEIIHLMVHLKKSDIWNDAKMNRHLHLLYPLVSNEVTINEAWNKWFFKRFNPIFQSWTAHLKRGIKRTIHDWKIELGAKFLVICCAILCPLAAWCNPLAANNVRP